MHLNNPPWQTLSHFNSYGLMDDDFCWQPYKHGWLIYLMLSCLFASMKTDVGCLKITGASLETCMLHFLELTHEVFSYILKYISLLWHTGKKKNQFFFCTWQLNDPVSRQLGCGRIWVYSKKKKKEFQCENQSWMFLTCVSRWQKNKPKSFTTRGSIAALFFG